MFELWYYWLLHLATESVLTFINLVDINFVQGTNSTFVFTNISGQPVVYRPTGIYFLFEFEHSILYLLFLFSSLYSVFSM